MNTVQMSYLTRYLTTSFQLVDKDLHEYEAISMDSEKGKQLMATKGNCALDTSLLSSLYPAIQDADESLRHNFEKIVIREKIVT